VGLSTTQAVVISSVSILIDYFHVMDPRTFSGVVIELQGVCKTFELKWYWIISPQNSE
jgi:hypothetical protein